MLQGRAGSQATSLDLVVVEFSRKYKYNADTTQTYGALFTLQSSYLVAAVCIVVDVVAMIAVIIVVVGYFPFGRCIPIVGFVSAGFGSRQGPRRCFRFSARRSCRGSGELLMPSHQLDSISEEEKYSISAVSDSGQTEGHHSSLEPSGDSLEYRRPERHWKQILAPTGKESQSPRKVYVYLMAKGGFLTHRQPPEFRGRRKTERGSQRWKPIQKPSHR
mmetsp:Transcript_19222/g.39476  ORF Transcript_19222/g.39476 Transcript_19222/m.39476 type:complete len:218 (-) Transcript_19222:427-1080(-)